LNLAGMFAVRLILLSKGSVVAEGRPGEVMREEVLSEVYGVRMVRMEKDGVVGVVAAGEGGEGASTWGTGESGVGGKLW
jgi:ABC-type cobalamin/Fe3+-siderophores transport system ATPase subunit